MPSSPSVLARPNLAAAVTQIAVAEEDSAASGLRAGHASLRIRVVKTPKAERGDWLRSALSTPAGDADALERLSSMSSPISPSFCYSPSGAVDSFQADSPASAADVSAAFKLFSNPLAESADDMEQDLQPAGAVLPALSAQIGALLPQTHRCGCYCTHCATGLTPAISTAESASKSGAGGSEATPLQRQPSDAESSAGVTTTGPTSYPLSHNISAASSGKDGSTQFHSPGSLDGSSASYLETEVPLSHVRRFNTTVSPRFPRPLAPAPLHTLVACCMKGS